MANTQYKAEIIKNKLEALREKTGLSQQEVAVKLGVSVQSIARWESGTGMPSVPNTFQLCALYKTALEHMYPELHKKLAKEIATSIRKIKTKKQSKN